MKASIEFWKKGIVLLFWLHVIRYLVGDLIFGEYLIFLFQGELLDTSGMFMNDIVPLIGRTSRWLKLLLVIPTAVFLCGFFSSFIRLVTLTFNHCLSSTEDAEIKDESSYSDTKR